MADRNEQIDDDILQCKADILRARDIIPGTPEPNKARSGSHPPDKEKTGGKDTTEAPAEPASAEQEKNEIPQFDLAEDIMAEQRKIAAVRRKAPGEKTKPESHEPRAEEVGYTVEQSEPAPSYKNQIIAEIVARDIKKYHHNTP